MKNGFIVALAWPETKCKQAGAWYDGLMNLVGVNCGGYYQVGHAALLLISDEDQTCEYFDFGRYHTPHGYGRVRNSETDHDLAVTTRAMICDDRKTIENLDQILNELSENPSCHGDGPIYASYTRVTYDLALATAKKMQQKDFIAYGPFARPGTNCSRFVNRIIRAGQPTVSQNLALLFPYSVSPTPMTNVRSLKSGKLSIANTLKPAPIFSLKTALR